MELNQDRISGKWLEIRGNIQKAWGKLTDDELEKTKGDFKAISGLIQQRYGDAQDNFHKKLKDIFEHFEDAKEGVTSDIKAKLHST